MIVFQKPINSDKLRMAFNNDVIRFWSDSLAAPEYCDISFTGVEVRLYPSPDGTFYFNFRPYVSALINTRNFEDTLQTDFQTTDPQSFVYNHDDGTIYPSEVTITIGLAEGEPDTDSYLLQWLAAVEQLNDYQAYTKVGIYVMSPVNKDNLNRWYLKYWEGYPFDIPFYFTFKDIKLSNETNGMSQSFEFFTTATRLFISDGRTDATIEDVFPIVQGYNNIRIINENPSVDDKYIDLIKIDYRCGVYFKWLNNMGGYSYWLFENTFSLDRSSKDIGELDRDNSNLEDTFARAIQIGRESKETVRVVTELLNENDMRVLATLLDSPKIYMFTGTPFSQNDFRDWIEVTIKTGNVRLKNARQPLNNMVLDFELPQRYTQTL